MNENSLLPKFWRLCLLLVVVCVCVNETKKIDVLKVKPVPSSSSKATIPNKEEWYPTFHISPPSGWMNDPNGLIYFDGYYHVFYQHNPDAPVWGLMHWGHVRSKDLITWEQLPIALKPTIAEDSDGCFSGSAVDNGGILTLIYTGNSANGQVQCLTTSKDTLVYEKATKILDAPGGNRDFRDPKVWREDNTWYMLVGIRIENHGEVYLYKSADLHSWELDRVLAKGNDNLGFMWECPDFFQIGNKHVLLVSPQGIPSEGYNYRNLHQSGYYVGTWQPGSDFNIEQQFTLLDNGHDFYASQTLLAPDGRQILISWMDMWESPMPEQEQGWCGMMSLPRELTLTSNNRLRINPVKEIENYRLTPIQINDVVVDRQYLELENNVKLMEIITTWDLKNSDAEKYGLRLGDASLGEAGLYVYVDNQSKRLILDRRYPQFGLSGYRSIALPSEDLLTLRVFFDGSGVEVFVNDGEATLSSRIYPQPEERHLSLFADQGRATLKTSSRWGLGKK